MNYARFYFFEPVRFLADVDDSFDAHMSSEQQPEGLFAAGLSLCIRALRAGMEFILAENFPVRLYSCHAPTAMEALRRDRILLFLSIDRSRANQASSPDRATYGATKMKFLRVNVRWIPKLFHMA